MNDLELFKQKFDVYFDACLEKKIKNISKFTVDFSILSYIDYLKRIFLPGGKRIRPYLAFLIYKTLNGKGDKKVLELLVFLEIFHDYCLVHDDIIDKSNLRHGIPTANVFVSNYLKKEKRIGDLNHVGNSQAILLGDILLIWSQEILNLDKKFPQETINKVKEYYYEMVNEVIVGQMIDVDISTRKNIPKELIDEKTKLKTAGYSFINPLLIGAALCGKDSSEIKTFCKEFGLAMGVAFQTQDDLLDISSSDNKLGKRTSLDKSQNQHTYFTYFPSLEYGKKLIADNFKKAKKLVGKLKIENLYKRKFINLIEIIEKRSF